MSRLYEKGQKTIFWKHNKRKNHYLCLLSKGAKDPVDLCSARTEVERRMVDSRKVKVDFSLENIYRTD